MIASNAPSQNSAPVSSNEMQPQDDNTETRRIGVTFLDRFKLYKKYISTQQRMVFVSRCVDKSILLNSNKRHNTPVDLCLIIQKRRLEKDQIEYERMKRQYSKYWIQFSDKTRERLRNFKYKLKTKLKNKYQKLIEMAPKSNQTRNQKSRKRRNMRKETRRNQTRGL